MNHLDRQEVYWDSVAGKKSFTHPVQIDKFRQTVPLESKILDYGCGYGRTCAYLYENGYRNVVGVDISSQMIKQGLNLYNNLNLQHLENGARSFSDKAFAACTLLAVLTCLPTDNGQKELIDELHRVLRPGGILYLSDYPLQSDAENIERYKRFEAEFGKFGVFRLADGGVVRHHDMDWIYSLLAQFDILTEENMDVLTMNGSRATIFQIIARRN